VATPLGNLEDMTFRAVRVLGQADLAAAEDTRRTRKLLTHYGLSARLISYREQNQAKVLPKLIETLKQGRNIALVSDAGTPGISDPGVELVRRAAESGAAVVPIPGPSAVACALSAAGLPADSYLFVGFPPARPKARQEALAALRFEQRTLVFYEAPHRLAETLQDMVEAFGNRAAVICREMTKVHEEFIRGGLAELAEGTVRRKDGLKGEITLVVAGSPSNQRPLFTRAELDQIIRGDSRPVRQIVADLAGSTGLSRSELYRLVLETRGGR